MAHHMRFFLSQIGHDLKTANMLQALLRDNLPIVDRVRDVHISYFVNWLAKKKDPHFLEFLSVLCVCEEKAMTRNQTFILKQLLTAHEASPIFLDLKEKDGIVYVKPFGDKMEFIELKKFGENEEVCYSTLFFYP